MRVWFRRKWSNHNSPVSKPAVKLRFYWLKSNLSKRTTAHVCTPTELECLMSILNTIQAQLLFASVIHIWHDFRVPFLLYLQMFCCCTQKCSHSSTNNCNGRFQKFSASYRVRRVSKINSSKCWVYLAIWKNVHVYSFNKIMLLDIVIYGRIYGCCKENKSKQKVFVWNGSHKLKL